MKESTKDVRPAADETCTLGRTVERDGLRLAVWTCSAPTPTIDEPCGDLHLARLELRLKIGRRLWRFFYVDPAEANDEDAEDRREPGWWFNAVNPNPNWMSNDPVGPYASFEEARDDLVSAESGVEDEDDDVDEDEREA